MTADRDGRVRLTVLGGFLGSGKTTWLRHQLHEGAFADALVIVNEAADTSVDDALLWRAQRTEILSGGCVCCEGRAGFVDLLRRICDERSRSASTSNRLDRIVLETSGLADPGPIVQAIRDDTVLVHHILVSEVVVAVDALNGLDQLRGERLGRRQIEAADRLIMTKMDAAEDAAVASLAATLRVLNPHAEIAGSLKGAPATLPTVQAEAVVLPALDNSDLGPLRPTTLHLDAQVDWTTFAVWLSALLHARGDEVVRVKGVVRTPAGRLLLQTVRKVVQSPEVLRQDDARSQEGDNRVVVIGRGYDPTGLARSLRSFAGLPP
ncbi:MAG TPA: GTP-binding protein [Lichenihabitans sp.]|nr:GTP-binding protein [Lichenihabitans sp.]